MAALEVDPDIRKAIRLMFSAAPDSTDLLRSMLEDAIKAKHGATRSLGNIVTIPAKPTTAPAAAADDELCIVLNRDSDNSESEKDADDDEVQALELEMMEDDLKCFVCKEMNVGQGNRLIECIECHELYHQECHSPTILDKEVDDPRKTWYCSSCKQATAEAAKQTSLKTGSSAKSLRSSPNLLKDVPPTNTKSSSQKGSDTSSLFKRSERPGSSGGTASSASSGTLAPKTSGLAAMAASLQKSSNSSSSKSSGGKSSGPDSPAKSSASAKTFSSSTGSSGGKISSSTSVPSPTSSTNAADKRLQNMKKKAATKLQEKRKQSK